MYLWFYLISRFLFTGIWVYNLWLAKNRKQLILPDTVQILLVFIFAGYLPVIGEAGFLATGHLFLSEAVTSWLNDKSHLKSTPDGAFSKERV